MDERTRELLEQANKELALLDILYSLRKLTLQKTDIPAAEEYQTKLRTLMRSISTHLKENSNV